MKNFAIIGLGSLGKCMLESFERRRTDVVVIDCDEQKIQWARDLATQAVKADALNFELLKEVLPEKVDCVVIDTGRKQLERSILITNYVHKMGVPNIVVHAASTAHAEILDIVGATRVVFPEEEAAERLAGVLVGRGRLDFFPVSEEFSVVEVPAPKAWIGQNLQELEVRKKSRINVVALRTTGDEEHWRFPDPDYRYKATDIVLLAGNTKDLERTKT